MGQTQESAMMDKCQLYKQTLGAIDDYGMPVQSFTWSSEIICGFSYDSTSEAMPLGQVQMTIATMRLPLGTDVVGVDRLKLTWRFDKMLAEPLMFKVVGPPQNGVSGIVLNLTKYTE